MAYSVSEFAKIFADRRESLHLLQSEVGKLIGAPQSYIARFESGRYDIRLSRFVEFARVLGLDVVVLPKSDAARLKTMLKAATPDMDQSLYELEEDDDHEDD